MNTQTGGNLVSWFEESRKDDTPLVGGKTANLGEMMDHE